MPNFNAFGNINHPVVTAGVGQNASRNGILYFSTTNLQSVGANAFLAFQLFNPTTANQAARIVRVFAGGQVNTTQFYIRNGTLNGGVTLSGFNGNFGFPDRSQMIPSFSISTVNPVTDGVTLASIIQTTGPIANEEGGRLIIPPSSRFIILLQKNAVGVSALTISVSWVEQ
ncbi:hypothetical protein [Paenibacillus prosopidis]|uniref:Uncharacterized protein n=1 Tax=Paenibacillus prosopidis TaxID=630520 RepID=A0A368W6S4_9BACL|nr:hypothetical protein [Paenibacillus prosopidis]RCW49536.1 hypothetical protein DFP97_104194 [Paenibacillus prosopidis]